MSPGEWHAILPAGSLGKEMPSQAFISTHTILRVDHGEFISLLEPPEELLTVAQECQNVRTWPVLMVNSLKS